MDVKSTLENTNRRNWTISNVYGKVLEIGSEEGNLLLGLPLDIVLIDIRKFKTNFPFVIGDAQSLPFKDNIFDCVVVEEVLEHVHNPVKLLKESIRVVRNEGRLLITTPHEERWNSSAKPFTNPDHRRQYNADTLISQLDELNLAYTIGYIIDGPFSFYTAMCHIS